MQTNRWGRVGNCADATDQNKLVKRLTKSGTEIHTPTGKHSHTPARKNRTALLLNIEQTADIQYAQCDRTHEHTNTQDIQIHFLVPTVSAPVAWLRDALKPNEASADDVADKLNGRRMCLAATVTSSISTTQNNNDHCVYLARYTHIHTHTHAKSPTHARPAATKARTNTNACSR